MGSVSTPDLAVAVADAGGVGTITALGMPPEYLDGLLAEMTGRTNGVLAVNFLTEQMDREAVAAAAARVRIIDFFWAEPDPAVVDIAHAEGALACWQVGSPDEAVAAVDAGCDLVAVQGVEAGGHVRGRTPLAPLLEATLDRVEVPVLAAGGIGEGEQFADVLAAGAAGARVGTRFVASTESGAHPLYKQAVVDAAEGSTEITAAFAVCPLCATSPRARVLSSCVHALDEFGDGDVGETVMGGQRVALAKGHGMPPGAAASGRIDAMAMYAGESVGRVDAVEPAAQIIRSWCATLASR